MDSDKLFMPDVKLQQTYNWQTDQFFIDGSAKTLVKHSSIENSTTYKLTKFFSRVPIPLETSQEDTLKMSTEVVLSLVKACLEAQNVQLTELNLEESYCVLHEDPS